MMQDLRIAVRSLLRRRTFTVVAILTLATGIAATTAIFSLVDAVLLRPLPYREASRLYRVWQAWPDNRAGSTSWDRGGISYPQYLGLRETKDAVENAAAFLMMEGTISGRGDAVKVKLALTSPALLATLGLRPLAGRDFSSDDEAGPGASVMMIGYDLWRRRFGGDRAIVGQTIRLDQRPYSIIGVMPPELRGFGNALFRGGSEYASPDVWVPVGRASNRAVAGQGHGYIGIVRLKSGVDATKAETAIVQNLRTVLSTYWLGRGSRRTPPYGRIEPLGRFETLPGRAGLLMLLAGAAIVLLVACGNVANLMLAESSPRTRELALRATLGAGRRRLVRMLLTESVVLAIAGGLLGLGVAWWSIDALAALAPPGMPNIDAVRLDYRVFVFSLAVTVSTGVAFGLLPAWLAARTDVVAGLREAHATPGRLSSRIQRIVCAAQVALAATVLVSAALLVQSLFRLSRVDPGFRTDGMLTFAIDLPNARYRTPAQARAFYRDLRERLAALPGARAVTQANAIPFVPRPYSSNGIRIDGRQDEKPVEAERRLVLANYFDVLGIRLVEGEPLRGTDDRPSDPTYAAADQGPSSPCRLVVNRTTARSLWPSGGAIGARVRASGEEPCTVVGVVEDVKERNLAATPLPAFYAVNSAGDGGDATLILVTDVPPETIIPAVRKIVANLDPEVPMMDVATMAAIVDRTLGADRYRTIPLALFALAALLLSGIGTYGTMAQMVVRQTRALGIRLALGASPRQVMALVLRHTAAIAVAGLAIGVGAALVATRLFRAFLFGVTTTDAVTYVGTMLLLAGVLFLAGWFPARRATRLDPAAVLRAE